MSRTVAVTAEIDVKDFVESCGMFELISELDLDEVLAEVDANSLCEFVANNHASKVLKEIDEDAVIYHVRREVTMSALWEGLEADDQQELREMANCEDEPDQPKLDADQWDLVKCGLKAIITLRGLVGSGEPGDSRGRKEQAIVDLINNHFPS